MPTDPPPRPPPLPATLTAKPAQSSRQPSRPSIGMKGEVSRMSLKFQAALEAEQGPLAPCGPYFFYGTLMDPSLLVKLLSLTEKPQLRPAKLIDYSLRLWGQYPALVDDPGHVVEGMVYYVSEKKHAERLARYETGVYRPTPCRIYFTDDGTPEDISGSCFKFVGNPSQLKDRRLRAAELVHEQKKAQSRK